MPQVFKDFLRRRDTGNEPARHNQIEKYVNPDEFYEAVLMDIDQEWTWYDINGVYCEGDPRDAVCIHFQSKAFDTDWGEGNSTCTRYCPYCHKHLD